MKLAVFPVDMLVLKGALFMPDEYEIVGLSFDTFMRRIDITVQSDTFPETQEGQRLPVLRDFARIEVLPDTDPAYRKITVEYSVQCSNGQVV